MPTSPIPEVAPEEAHRRQQAGAARLVDVRESHECAGGRIPGAVWLPRGRLAAEIAEKASADEELILFCEVGARSVLAAESLRERGYRRVSSLAGGFTRWVDEGLPVESSQALSREERERYRRHLVLPEIGEAGQRRLLDSRVLVVGVGGLGSPVALYLAAAGVGTLGLVDADVVDVSNLQRQVLHSTDRIGMPKVESARVALQALNPAVKVVAVQARLDTSNVSALLRDHDVVVTAVDNFPTRYLLNDACVLQRKPLVDGSVFRFDGQVTVYRPGVGPCYRCLFPTPPPPELIPSCSEAGVLGVLPGVIGVLQANEVLKLLTGAGEPLVGRLLTFDALHAEFRCLKVQRDPACPSCREGASPKLEDLDLSCRLG